MLENKLTKKQGIHYTRYIMSWLNVGGSFDEIEYFIDWLKYNDVTKDEIREIVEMCYCAGALELEKNAKEYVSKQKEAIAEFEKS